MQKVVLTGSNGFIGKRFVEHFSKEGSSVTLLPLNRSETDDKIQEQCEGASHFFHFAGMAHKRGNYEAFREANVDFSLHMAELAEWAEVKTFIYISSVAVFGDVSGEVPFSETCLPNPQSPYGISKMRAEERLKEFFKDKDTKLIIIRPPLVYAPSAPGNIGQLRFALQKKIPLPFLGLTNKRAVLTIEDFLLLCEEIIKGDHKDKTLLLPVSQHLSTPEIYERLAADLKITPKMFKLRPDIFEKLKKIPKLGSKAEKLISNFEIQANWSPDKQETL